MDELRSAWLKLKSCVDELTHERQHYVAFFEQADAAYFVTDTRGMIVEVNGAAVDLLDQRRHNLCGRPLATLVSAEQRRQFRRELNGLSHPRQWRSALASRGRRIDVELRARPLPGERGIVWSVYPAG